MADHADDNGENCFPSVDRIVWKTGYKPRNITDIIRELKASGVLEEVAPETQHKPIEYRVHLDKAKRKSPFNQWQEQFGRHARGAISRKRFS